jgi:hypothetical protein
VIVCGSRKAYETPAKQWLFTALRDLHEINPIARVIHGDCPNSPDQWAAEWCEENHIYCEAMPAAWDTFGKAAGNMRNEAMAKYVKMSPGPGYCFAVWDGKSPGTLNMIKQSVKSGFGVEIIPASSLSLERTETRNNVACSEETRQ